MQLFKSQCFQEPHHATTFPSRDGGFGRRYGRHGAQPACDLRVASNDDDGDFEFEAERAILRLMADYDRVA